MSDSLFIPIRKESEPNSKTTTTFIVDNVPSEIAYNIIMRSLQNGEPLSSEELRERANAQINGNNIKIAYNDLLIFFNTYYDGFNSDRSIEYFKYREEEVSSQRTK